MKKAIGLLILLAWVGTGLAATSVSSVPLHSHQIILDGLDSDWEPDSLLSVGDFQVRLGLRHDQDFLYAVLVFDNHDHLGDFLRSGITLWVNDRGNSRKLQGLHFQLVQLSAEQLLERLHRQGRSLSESQKQQIRQQGTFFLHRCRRVEKDGARIDLPRYKNTVLPEFRSRKNSTGFILEFRIPLSGHDEGLTFLNRLIGPSSFALGWEWGGLSSEQRQELLKTQYQNTADPMTCTQENCGPGKEKTIFRRKIDPGITSGKKNLFWIKSRLNRE